MPESSKVNKLSIEVKVKSFFINPAKIFEGYIEKPAVIIKIFIITAAVILFGYAESTQKALLIQKSVEKLKNYNYSKGIYEIAKQNIENGASFSAPSLISNALFGTAVSIALVSLIYWFLTRLFDGENDYKDTLAVYTLSYIPQVLYLLFVSIYILAAHKIPFEGFENNLYLNTILGAVNPIKIWQIVLLIIGLAKVGNITKKKAAVIVIGFTNVSLLFSLGCIAIGNNLMSGIF